MVQLWKLPEVVQLWKLLEVVQLWKLLEVVQLWKLLTWGSGATSGGCSGWLAPLGKSLIVIHLYKLGMHLLCHHTLDHVSERGLEHLSHRQYYRLFLGLK